MRSVLFAVLFACTAFASSLTAGENWNNPPSNLPAGAEHKTFMSASMKTEVGYNIYLPPGYSSEKAADKTTRWPVLYFLHGRGGTESSHTGAFAQFDQAIKDKKIPPFIYVHAMCGRNSGYVDAVDGSIMGETVFIKELIPHIDATYRTFAAKGGRAIEGFSKGGQGALLFAFKFPELFSSCIGYAAGLASGAELKQELPAVFKQMHNDDITQFDDTSAWAWVRRNADKLKTGIAIKQVIGDQDVHLDRNHRMDALMKQLGIPHDYLELPGIGHDTGRVYHDVGVDGFVFHAQHFDLTLPKTKKK